MRQLLKRGCLAPQAVNDVVGHLLSNCEPLLGPEGMAALSHKSIAITCHHPAAFGPKCTKSSTCHNGTQPPAQIEVCPNQPPSASMCSSATAISIGFGLSGCGG